jgi:hypothetical protein
MIYEYALTEEGGLIGDVPFSPCDSWIRFRGANEVNREAAKESNQLRYACRQLYAETTGLDLPYNDIVFPLQYRGPTVVIVYDHFDQFVYNCSPIYLTQIKRITILDNENLKEKDLAYGDLETILSPDVFRFCPNYSTCAVIVRFDWPFDTGSIQYHQSFEYIDAMYYCLRGHARMPTNIHKYNTAQRYWFARRFKGVPCPANLCFSIEWKLDEERVSEGLGANLFLGQGGGFARSGASLTRGGTFSDNVLILMAAMEDRQHSNKCRETMRIYGMESMQLRQ